MAKYDDLSVNELIRETNKYIRRHWDNFGTSEFDTSINDISRALIDAFYNEHDTCFLGRINLYETCERNNPNYKFTPYNGQTVYNFEYCFVVPHEDEELLRLIIEHNKEGVSCDLNLINRISERIAEIGGITLWWV